MHRYRVEIKKGTSSDVLYSPFTADRQIYDDELSVTLGATPTFNFSVPPENPALQLIKPLAAKIYVYDGDTVIYDGRVSNDSSDILKTGIIETVGSMSYLADSMQAPFSFSGTAAAFVSKMLASHNAQSEAKFQAGEIMTGNVSITSNEYRDTLSLMQEALSEGYIRVRYISDNSYAVDYNTSFGQNDQVVRLGENIADLTGSRDPADIITRLIPLGAELEANDTSELPRYVKINVNGNDYIENTALKAEYGTITRTVQWDSITDPEELLTVAQAYLSGMALPESFEVSAVDLSYIDDNVEAFEVGYNTHIISSAHDIDTWYLLAQKTIHLTNPANDSIILGEVEATLSKQVVTNKVQAAADNADTKTQLGNTIVQTGMTITGAKGGYVVLDTYDDNGNAVSPWQILVMDTPDKTTAKNVIRLTQNGLGFSLNGYNGSYDNAWTIDGKLNATYIRSGNLTLGGKTWNTEGAIVILDANDKEIGRWDKNGLSVKKGSIEGTTISVGPLVVNGDELKLGDYIISADGLGMLKSEDESVEIYSGHNPHLTVHTVESEGVFGDSTVIGGGTVDTVDITAENITSGDMNLNQLADEYGDEWASVSKNIIELWNRVGGTR